MGLLYNRDGLLRWPLGLLLGSRLYPRAIEHASATMRAYVYEAHGPVDNVAITRIPIPVCVQGQVLVRVVGAGVNPVDIKLRANPIPSEFCPMPKVPGTDISGIVVSAPAHCAFRVGERVFGMMPLLGARWGACEELVAIDETLLARAPESHALLHAAALPMPALTVLQALRPIVSGRHSAGMTILIHAGSGGVGSFAVQYCAHVLGMHVFATCSAGSAELVQSLGCERVIDYEHEDFTKVLGKHSVDVVLDVLSFLYEERTLAAELLRPGGHYVQVASSPWQSGSSDQDPLGLAIPEARLDRLILGAARAFLSRWPWATVRRSIVFVHPDGRMLQEVAQMVDARQIKPCVGKVFPLEDVRDAQALVETGHAHGKVLVQLADEDEVRRALPAEVGIAALDNAHES